MADRLDFAYDRFIRTTEPGHYDAAPGDLAAMEANGDIYLDRYEGWYSVRDEAYYDEAETRLLEDGSRRSLATDTPVEWTVEESWFFRLSAYQDRLLALYEDQPDFIRPESRRNEVASFVAAASTTSRSRAPTSTGACRCRAHPKHVMYVWVDALTNYLTVLGLPRRVRSPKTVLAGGPPRDRQGYRPLPRGLLAGLPDVGRAAAAQAACSATASCSTEGEKMSKSLGNVARPVRARRHLRRRSRCATSCCARSASGRTAATATRRSSAGSTPISPTISATSPSARSR